MNRYTYRCGTGHEFELRRKIRDRDIFPKCIHCGKETKRKFSRPKIFFIGKGFYSTDNPK
jgi:putative FmdB family regulatory protein